MRPELASMQHRAWMPSIRAQHSWTGKETASTVGRTFRAWRHQRDVSAGVSWATGRASVAGMHAFFMPASIAFTLAWIGIIAGDLAGGLSAAGIRGP
jgi:hypothetical protein